MRKTYIYFLAPVILFGLSNGGEARPDDNRTAYMTVTARTSQPIGHYEFCQDHQAECSVRTASPKPVKLTQTLWNELTGVNDAVNDTVTPKTDLELYGVEERWAYPAAFGDCEDYALLKRRMLIDKGWPAAELLMTVVRQRNGDGHAVLTVRTDRGDLVLDNLEARILVWVDTDYQFVKRQSEFDSGQWMAISDGRAPPVDAVGRSVK
ncbi:MAG: transglutaminase-like cysteine peptidase [Bauldia sp.]